MCMLLNASVIILKGSRLAYQRSVRFLVSIQPTLTLSVFALPGDTWLSHSRYKLLKNHKGRRISML